MPKNSLNVSLKGADDIFSTEESRQEQQREQVQQIPIGEQKKKKNHRDFFRGGCFFEDYIIFLKIASTSFLSQICGQGYKGLASCRAFVMQSSRSSSLMSWLPSFARILSGMFMEEFIALIH